MPLTIRDTNTTPRERYWPFPSVEDGKELKSNSWMNLKNEVLQHYRANGRTVPTEQEIIDYVCRNVSVPCYEGREPFRNSWTDPVSFTQRGLKSPNWPLLLQPFKLLAKEGDRGLGDIVHRVIGESTSEKYKQWHLKIFGKPCGCSERQNTLNIEFPL